MSNYMALDEIMRVIYELAGERPETGPWTIDVVDLESRLIAADRLEPVVQPPEQDSLGMP